MTHVTVAVATYRRPERLPLLIERLRAEFDEVEATDRGLTVEAVFIDNDPGRTGEAAVDAASGGEVRIRCVLEARPGVAAVRNRALDESETSDILIFIDDDETPEPGWLAALLQARARFAAQAVSGPVVSIPDGEADAWVSASRSNDRIHRAGLVTGDAVDRAATNNLLLDRAWVQRAGLRFDERFGLTGGEDSLFTRQLVRAGGRIVWCREAVVFDHVPVDRMNREYNLHRAYTLANAGARVDIVLAAQSARWASAMMRLRLVAVGVVRAVAGAIRAVLGRATRSLGRTAAGERWMARARGELAAAVGVAAAPYRRG